MNDQEELKDLKAKIKAAHMPPEVEIIANQELDRLKKILSISPEFTVARTYIEWLCDMPWDKSCPTKIDVKVARKILDEDHYGLEKIKERILEYLAVCQLNEKCGATILCFVGPPGVGKTSLGKSIARALGRAFIHTSLGGIRDEADIRGHRRTYVGAMPGRIIQSIKRAQCNDAVFMLDEVDKIGRDFQGDPASALLEALDPEQNNAFTDHYLDVPFDLSKVFFITTANILDPIPPALLDRMEIIELPGYTEEEKLQIAKKYLLPKQLGYNGLDKYPYTMTDEAIMEIIRSYTFEAGLRELERQIGTISRKIAKDFIEKKKKPSSVGASDIQTYLGVTKYEYEVKQEEDMVGVATGLAWTPNGGDIIFIEAARMRGSKNLILTGSLGDVMQESARAALSYIRSNASQFHIKDSIFEKSDIHIHVPEGATPKDGPSAGITICTALISLLTNQKVRRDVAMTGEVTLTGRILPIGGLKEKLLAAKRARIKTIIIPERNKKDLADIPKHLLSNLNIHFAKTLDDVMKIAIIPAVKRTEPKFSTKIIQLPKDKKTAVVNVVRMSGLIRKKR
jgi:ATP-dependent Lon protease